MELVAFLCANDHVCSSCVFHAICACNCCRCLGWWGELSSFHRFASFLHFGPIGKLSLSLDSPHRVSYFYKEDNVYNTKLMGKDTN